MLKYFLYLSFFLTVICLNANANELKVNSDKLTVDRISKISVFTGNVYAYNQDIKIWSEKLIIKFTDDDQEIQQLNAENSVKIINQGITATGENGIYYPNSDTLHIYGNVEVSEKDNYIKCDELFLDIKNATSTMKSSSKKRVEAYIAKN